MYNPDEASDEKILRMAAYKSQSYCSGWIDNLHRRHLVSVITRRGLDFDVSTIPMGPHPEFTLKSELKTPVVKKVELTTSSWEEIEEFFEPVDANLYTAVACDFEPKRFTYRMKYRLDRPNNGYAERIHIYPTVDMFYAQGIPEVTKREAIDNAENVHVLKDVGIRLIQEEMQAFYKLVFMRNVEHLYVHLPDEPLHIRSVDLFLDHVELQLSRYVRLKRAVVTNVPNTHMERLVASNASERQIGLQPRP